MQPAEVRSASETIRQREGARRVALITGDSAAFAEILADDLIHVHTTGSVHGKTELLHHAIVFLEFFDIERGPLDIRFIGPDAAVMTGSMTNTVRRRGHGEHVRVDAFVTQVWIKQSNTWRVVRFHATRIDDTQGA